jgi:hypothetical protein
MCSGDEQNNVRGRTQMNTLTQKSVLVLVASLSLISLAAVPASAAENKLMLVSPGLDPDFAPEFELPRFGFSSFNIGGVGERVTYVRWGGLASQFGLEPGDIVLSMNDVRLTYHGSWNDALRHAILEHDGLVSLRIRDVRTGLVARRQMFVGGAGPIVHHYNHDGNAGPIATHSHQHLNIAPTGPNTLKSTIGGDRRLESNRLRITAKLAE